MEAEWAGVGSEDRKVTELQDPFYKNPTGEWASPISCLFLTWAGRLWLHNQNDGWRIVAPPWRGWRKWIKIGLNGLDGGKNSHRASEREREANVGRAEQGTKQETPLWECCALLIQLWLFTVLAEEITQLLRLLITPNKAATSTGLSLARGPEVRFRVRGSRKDLLLQGSSELFFFFF